MNDYPAPKRKKPPALKPLGDNIRKAFFREPNGQLKPHLRVARDAAPPPPPLTPAEKKTLGRILKKARAAKAFYREQGK